MKKYKLLLWGAILPFFLFSCSKWLDVRPEDEIAEEDAFTSGDGFRHALNGIYYSMESQNMYGMYLTWGIPDALGQVYSYSYSMSNELENAAEYEWENKNLKPVLEAMWKETYYVVANCNNLIQQIRDADPDMFYAKSKEKSAIWGEALALRAFLQFDMLRLYAPAPITNPGNRKFVPYVQEYPSYVSQLKTVDECLTAIVEDLRTAKELLWKTDSANTFTQGVFDVPGSGESTFLTRRGYRLNYWAATALLARVYLYAQKGNEALEQANEIIEFATTKGAFPFRNNASNGDIKFYSDVIWGLHVIDLSKIYSTVNRIENVRDQHYLEVCNVEGNYFGEDMTQRNGVWQCNDRRFTYWIEDMNNYHYYYRFKKYDEEKYVSYINISNTMVPLVRMSEMYYVAAEILANQGDEGLTKAKSYLKLVKQGRGLRATDNSMLAVDNALSSDDFMNVLINDMRRDWIGEGQTFYIYKRLNKDIPGDRSSIAASEKVFVIPLPDGETNL